MRKEKNKYSTIFLMLSILFTVCLVISNILAAKIVLIWKWSVTAGVLVFPISYIINDLLSEVYGYKYAKKVIFFGFAMLIFAVVSFQLAIVFPSPIWYENENAFEQVLGSTPRVAIACLLAYLCGSIINSKVLVSMKKRDLNNCFFEMRAIVSTIFGELTDSIVFVFLAFWGTLSFTHMLEMVTVQVCLKTLYEIILLPITSKLVTIVRRYEES